MTWTSANMRALCFVHMFIFVIAVVHHTEHSAIA